MACALLIGIGNYKCLGNLPAADADLRTISGICRERLNVEEEHVVTIAGECDAHILRVKVEQFCQSYSADDSFVFYFSGHGGIASVNEGEEEFSIYGSDDQPISMSFILSRLKTVFSRGFVIIDSCRAGAVRVEKASIDFLARGSHGFTVIASCGSQELSYPGSGDCPSVFTGQLKLAFDAIAPRRAASFPISSVIGVVSAQMGECNERELLNKMHPVSFNKYACDGVFSIDAEPHGGELFFEFDCSGLHFVASSMNSRDYRRVQASVILHEASEADLKEAFESSVFHDAVEEIRGNSAVESVSQQHFKCDKAIANIVFNVFPDEGQMRIGNRKWRIYWSNHSVPHSELCPKPDFEVGPFRVQRNMAFWEVRRHFEEHAADDEALARKLSGLYEELRYLLEEIGCAYDQVSTGLMHEDDFAKQCCKLNELEKDAANLACDLPNPSDSDDLESIACHLMGMSGPLFDITRSYTSGAWNNMSAPGRRTRVKELLGLCAESHGKLFA